jgi:tRNA nucleotidyltransferase (CCA-adding enzyme)
MEIIISHMNADFDACASMVAASRLYPEAKLVFPGSQEKKLRDFIEHFFPIPVTRLRELEGRKIERMIVVDTKSPGRLGPLEDLLMREDIEVHVYDHHEHGPMDIQGLLEVIEPVGATATIFTEILKERKLRPAPIEATLLMLGIYEETGRMLYPTTTERDLRAAAHLIKCGANLNIVSRFMKDEMSAEEIRLLNELTASSREEVMGGLKVVVAAAASETYIGDAAHMAHRLIDMDNADAAVMLLSMEGKVLVVGRSRTPQLNMAKAMEAIGGGGHPTAASATVEDQPLEILSEQVMKALEASIRPGKFAETVMTAPVVTIDHEETVSAAEEKMTRFEVNVLPMTLDGEYRGTISREDVEKAVYHGLKDRQIRDFASTEVATAERFTPAREVERRMIELNQRFMPVVEEGKVVGAITRTDLLRSLYDDYLRRSGVREEVPGQGTVVKNVSQWIEGRFPGEATGMLRLAGEVALSLGYSAYLVGGTVRDLMRGEENLDMDIVVEGNGISFASELATRLGAKVHQHERFKTAKLVSEGLRVDIATARTEYYESPASLPSVTASSIKKDLYRRDFTINTLAVKLNPGEFGKLVDYFGGQRDIKERTVRVLHNLSFVEDPTRAFRAVRFATRFGFRISRHTRNLIRSSIRMRLFEKLSGTRLYDELDLIFAESDPPAIVRGLQELDLLGVIHPDIEFTPELSAMVDSVHDTLLWFEMLYTGESPDRTVLYLSALLSALSESARGEAAARLAMPEKTGKFIGRSMEEAKAALRKLPLKDRAGIYEALSHMKLEPVLLAMSLTDRDEKKKEVAAFLTEIRKVAPLLDGNDLKRLGVEPGPLMGEMLLELRKERLRQKLKSREDEERFVSEYARTRGQ